MIQMDMDFTIWQEMFGKFVQIGTTKVIIVHLVKNKISDNPKGPNTWKYSREPYDPKKVIRGGSFLCNDSYCASYRVSARMPYSMDTGMSHTGFRCVKDI